MKKKGFIWITFVILAFAALVHSCSAPAHIKERSGAQLWGENCLRCHNSPSPQTFSDVQWDVAMMHMRVRANLTEREATEIAAFLKTAN